MLTELGHRLRVLRQLLHCGSHGGDVQICTLALVKRRSRVVLDDVIHSIFDCFDHFRNVIVSQFQPELVALVQEALAGIFGALVGRSLVLDDAVLYVEQVEGHGLIGVLVHQGGQRVESAVQDKNLGAIPLVMRVVPIDPKGWVGFFVLE